MTATRLFSILINLGVMLWIRIDNKLCWSAKKGVVTAELQEKIATYKNDLLSIIRNAQNDYISQHIDRIIHDDCLHALRMMPTDSVDLVATDAPYGLEFMNKGWDKEVPPVKAWIEVCRVLKPGAFAFVMCTPRQDRLQEMASLLKSAGFDIGFTSLYWTYATGFPKIYDIAKMIDKQAGATREVDEGQKNKNFPEIVPTSPEAKRFVGAYGGFQPKPAVEVILVAMKPRTEKTVVGQAMANSKGITWMDDCRLPYRAEESIPTRDYSKQRSYASGQVPVSKDKVFTGDARGRFPANILVSDDILSVGSDYASYFSLDRWFSEMVMRLPADVQAAFPFLIVPKPSKAEKDRGLEGSDPKLVNDHPTCKPIKLFSYLITMATRPGDLIADPFVGSGSSCAAAKMLGRRFIGIEKEEEYCRIAEARVAAVPDSLTKHQRTAGKDNKMKNVSYGFKEWAEKSVNFSTGCANNCRYCYAKSMAVRFKQVEPDKWATPLIRQHDVDKKHGNYGETIMFPSSHDLTPDNLEATLTVLGKLLSAGNRVLIVSKPHLAVVQAICEHFGEYRKNILFRFTITATDNAILAFWEPGAPSYEQRRDALAFAFDAGFETSVSVEPMLDADNIDQLVADLMPRVSHSIWIGKMNHMGRIIVDVPEVEQELERIRVGQTDDRILAIYDRHKDNPAIRWKGSIKDIVGIERPDKPGMDV